jgi:hypothetical protein
MPGQIAWRVYQESLLFDSDRISLSTKDRWYVELVGLFLGEAMLADLFSLRITCKANSDIVLRVYEEFIAYRASRFASTTIINAVIGLHVTLNDD